MPTYTRPLLFVSSLWFAAACKKSEAPSPAPKTVAPAGPVAPAAPAGAMMAPPSSSPKSKAAGYDFQLNVPVTEDFRLEVLPLSVTLDDKSDEPSDYTVPLVPFGGKFLNCHGDQERCKLTRLEGTRVIVPVESGGRYGENAFAEVKRGDETDVFGGWREADDERNDFTSVAEHIATKKEDDNTVVTVEKTYAGPGKIAVIFKEVWKSPDEPQKAPETTYRTYLRATFGKEEIVCDTERDNLAEAEKYMAVCLMLQST